MKRRILDISRFEKDIIKEYQEGKSTNFICKKYQVYAQLICKLLSKEGITIRNNSQAHRKYQLHEDYFNTIDTPEKAYILGLLYADGCNSPENNAVRLILSEQDKTLLEKISSIIYIQYRPLSLRKGGYFIDKGKTYFRKNSYQLCILNKHISQTLIKHGLVKAKSFIVSFPQWLNESLIRHFIRGYFDGDGSISITSNQISISILGTLNFCSAMREITDKLSIRSSLCHAKRGSHIKQYVIHGNRAGRKFLEWIYKNADICMERKFNKYKEILNIIPEAKPIKCSLCDNEHYSHGYCKKHHYEYIGKTLRHNHYMKTRKLKDYS